jgi:tetratricopeptide (TPR) repeat protein
MLARRSQLAADLRNHGDAVDAAEAAVELARPGSRVEAIACTYAGYGHALQGNADNSARLYARASEYLESDEVDQYIYGDFFNASYLNVHQAHSSVVLGKPGAAASMFRSAIAELPDSFHRDRGVYLAMEAHAHAEGGELEEAVLVGFRALSVAHETGSARILRELAQVDSSLARRQSVPEVRSFRAALTEMLPRLA